MNARAKWDGPSDGAHGARRLRASTERPRIAGIDIARGFAIIGMFVAHAIPRANDAELLVDGRSSILFATLAGVSLGIMTGSERPIERGRRSDRLVSILLRALLIFLLGATLTVLDSGVLVILDFYAVMFLLLTPALFLPRWALGLIGAVLAVAAPAIAIGLDEASPTAQPVLHFVQFYLLTGHYPALVWVPFLIAGLISARSGLNRTKTQAWMIGAGTFSAVLGYGAAHVLPGATAEEHSGSTAEVLGSGGVAIAVIGGLLWLSAQEAPERRRLGVAVRRLFWPIAAIGSMSLTVYTLQIITLAVFSVLREESGGEIEYPGWPLLIGMTIASLVFASVWRRFLGKGPLERVLAYLTRTPREKTR